MAKQKANMEAATAVSAPEMASAPSNSQDRLLDFKEAATQLGVDARTIGRWAMPDRFGRRRLKTVRYPSGRRKVRQSVIDQILQATGVNGDATEEIDYDKE